MNRWMLSAFAAILLASAVHADIPPAWKDYTNALVGIQLQINNDWQVIEIKETKETGTAAFNLSPHTTISIVRQKFDQSFEVWLSSDVLTQIFKPGYKIEHAELAGRKSTLVIGQALDGRQQESYYSSRPPYVDEITFTSTPDEWVTYKSSFEMVKKTIRWTR